VPSDADELLTGLPPEDLALRNAEAKARSVAAGLSDAVVIGSDTVVALDGVAYGKPSSELQAAAMLGSLAGRAHQVHSAVAVVVCSPSGSISESSAVDTTLVSFRQLSGCQIDAHLALGEWRGRAGGYAIQESGHELVESLEGSLDTVVGLPMEILRSLLPVAVQP